MQYLLSEEELKSLKKYDPNNQYNRLVTILHKISTDQSFKDEKSRLKFFQMITNDVTNCIETGDDEAMLFAWEGRYGI